MASQPTLSFKDWFLARVKAPQSAMTSSSTSSTSSSSSKNSEAMQAFLVHYNRTLKLKTQSKTVGELHRAVVRAETGRNLIRRLPKMRDDEKTRDLLARLQFTTYEVANWVRRFVEDRYNAEEWNMVFEKAEAQRMVNEIAHCLAEVFARVTQVNGESKTNNIAFGAYETKWRQVDEAQVKQALVGNAKVVQRLAGAWDRVKDKPFVDTSKRTQAQFVNAMDELGDIKGALTEEETRIVNEVKQWMHTEKLDEPWRTDGVTALGPFGIWSKLNMDLEIIPQQGETGSALVEFEVKSPASVVQAYLQLLKTDSVRGRLSPIVSVTVRKNDPVAQLIRIPIRAKSFAFAYPVVPRGLVAAGQERNALDAFLLHGGFVYFDETGSVIQMNALWTGHHVQLGSAKPLPIAVRDELDKQGRFRDVTLDHLFERGARRFAWILPKEFPEHITVDHGGWCYEYEDARVNNYFCIASSDSILGKTKAANLELDA